MGNRGSSIDVLHEAFKIAHTYTFFDEKFYRFEIVFCIMILWFFSYFICVLCRAKILPQIYTRIITSLKPPPIYAHYMREKFRPRYIWGLRCVWNLWAIDWVLISLRSFVSCFVYAVIVWRRPFFVDWSMSKLDCKSVIGLHKLIVKMWLCICNCMCICVCIWYWL